MSFNKDSIIAVQTATHDWLSSVVSKNLSNSIAFLGVFEPDSAAVSPLEFKCVGCLGLIVFP